MCSVQFVGWDTFQLFSSASTSSQKDSLSFEATHLVSHWQLSGGSRSNWNIISLVKALPTVDFCFFGFVELFFGGFFLYRFWRGGIDATAAGKTGRKLGNSRQWLSDPACTLHNNNTTGMFFFSFLFCGINRILQLGNGRQTSWSLVGNVLIFCHSASKFEGVTIIYAAQLPFNSVLTIDPSSGTHRRTAHPA